MHARTHSEVFHLFSETLLVSFKANVLCVALKYKFCSNTADGNRKRRGCQSTAAVYQVIEPRPPERVNPRRARHHCFLSLPEQRLTYKRSRSTQAAGFPWNALIQNLSLKSQLSQALHGSCLLSLCS